MINNSSTLSSWWNNFNNGDEALFNDASLPRDSYWFKIQPWMQTDKNDWRASNSWIWLQQIIIKWWVKVPWTEDWQELAPKTTNFKKEYTSSDFSFLEWYTTAMWQVLSASAWAEERKAEEEWMCPVWVQGWDVVINQSWSYIIQAYCDFSYPSWYDSSTSYQYKEFVYLISDNKVSVRQQARACWTVDWVSALYVWFIKQWTRLNVWVAHTYTDADVVCWTALNVYKL